MKPQTLFSKYCEDNTLVSSANKMGSDKVFIVGGRSFLYIMKSKVPKIDPSGPS
jgi:hypothetical protein